MPADTPPPRLLMNDLHSEHLAAELVSWWRLERQADVLIVVEHGRRPLPAHRLVLAAASRLARRLLAEQPAASGPVTIHLPEVRAAEMRLLLQLLYTGRAAAAQVTHLILLIGNTHNTVKTKPPFWGMKLKRG